MAKCRMLPFKTDVSGQTVRAGRQLLNTSVDAFVHGLSMGVGSISFPMCFCCHGLPMGVGSISLAEDPAFGGEGVGPYPCGPPSDSNDPYPWQTHGNFSHGGKLWNSLFHA